MKPRITIIYGTRPEVIKLSPVVDALRRAESFRLTLMHTGQHDTLTDDLVRTLKMEPDLHLSKPPYSSTDFGQLLGLMQTVSEVLEDLVPDLILVQGDTASALAGAMAGHYQKIPVAHLEAGLRSHDRSQPFPEETNRILISSLADLHFAPTQTAADQLLREHVDRESVFMTGNSITDALYSMLKTRNDSEQSLRKKYNLGDHKLVLLTTHRRENLGNPQRRILQAVIRLANMRPDVVILWPVHPNPEIRRVLEELQLPLNVRTIPPLSYVHFIPLLHMADLVLTDSGGIQEEAPALGVPVVVLREKTERPEVIDAGLGVLAGSHPDQILEASNRFLSSSPVSPVQLYGDGTTSQKVVHHIKEWFKMTRNKD